MLTKTHVRVLLGALFSGLAMGLAFDPFAWAPLVLLGVGYLTWLISQRPMKETFGLGYLAGLVLMAVNSAGVHTLGIWIAVVLIAFMALWIGLIAVCTKLLQELPYWPLWVACAWSAIEFAYSRVPLGGFGWARLAFTTPDTPIASYLPLIGAGGVSWVVAFLGTLCAYAAINTNPRKLGTVTALVITIILGGLAASARPLAAGGELVTIGMVQGNVDGTAGAHAMGYARSVTNNHFSETVTLMARARTSTLEGNTQLPPDFLLWPENSTDYDPNYDEQTHERLMQTYEISGLPILVGAITKGPGEGERQTTAMWWTSEGEQVRYSKRNLVPFGEYTPLKSIIQRVFPITQQVGSQSVPGEGTGVLDVQFPNGRELKIGTIICYELAFDSTMYDVVRYGAEIVTVQSNNGTYLGTLQPSQQFAITRVRAMEFEREIAVSTTSGISGLIGVRGEILDITNEHESASRAYSVPIREGVSLGVRIGPIWELTATLLALAASLLALKSAFSTRLKLR